MRPETRRDLFVSHHKASTECAQMPAGLNATPDDNAFAHRKQTGVSNEIPRRSERRGIAAILSMKRATEARSGRG